MVQVYFLLVLCNLIMGVILTKDFLNSKLENFTQYNEILSSEIFQVTIGCIGTIVGILALFLRYTGNMIILGDIIPSLISITCGTTLFAQYIINEENMDSGLLAFFEKVFMKNRVILGFSALVVGIIHFVAPSIELL